MKSVKVLLIISVSFCINNFVRSQNIQHIADDTSSNIAECNKNRQIVKVLKDEPALIKKGCYDYCNKVDSFTIVLINQPSDVHFYISEIYPLGGVPKEYQIDNLYVLVRGTILYCEKKNNCTLPQHRAGNSGTYMFELNSIKINERGECSKCKDTTISQVLEDAPAYLQRGCYEEIDSFYIVLTNQQRTVYPCNGVPEEFKVEGLRVWVSGNILNCGKWNPCQPSKPNIRIAPTPILELKNIKNTTQ
jgi:hypothetical protein